MVNLIPKERRSPERISGRDLWLSHNALLDYVAMLEVSGDSMARIISAIDTTLPSAKLWNEIRTRNKPKGVK